MLKLIILIGRALALALRGHRELVLENLAVRQQLTALKRTTKRPRLQTGDRLFWVALARLWRNWELSPRTLCTLLRELSSRRRMPRIVLEGVERRKRTADDHLHDDHVPPAATL